MSILFRQLDVTPRLIAEALLNSIWQGVLLAFIIWLLVRLGGRKANAATRYSIWSATLLAVVCLPFLNAFSSSRTGETANLSSNSSRRSEFSSTPSVAAPASLELPVMNSTRVMNSTNAVQRASEFDGGEGVTASTDAPLISELSGGTDRVDKAAMRLTVGSRIFRAR
jgi:hypothetical protein